MKKLPFLLVFLAIASLSFANPPSRKSHARSAGKALAFPVAGTKSKIRDKWGASRDGGARKHKGIDIHARKGTPVVAVADGVIVERALTPIGGKTLWLKADNRPWEAYYAHLDKQLVSEGQHVHKGQVLGTVGNTGNAKHTPSHLHFGVKQGGRWVNPLPYVKSATKVQAKVSSKKKTKGRR